MIRPRAGQLLALAAAIVVLDQLTKSIVASKMTEGQSIPVVDGVLHWTFVRNPGAAFSLFTGVPWLFTLLAIGVSGWILWSARRPRTPLSMAAFGLILGGAMGNLVDRLFRGPAPMRGHVVDFIDFRVWPTFNIADSAVVLGAIALVVSSYAEERRDRTPDPEP